MKLDKEEFKAANHRQRARIISLEKDNETLRNERDSIQIRIRELMEENNTLKVKTALSILCIHHKSMSYFYIS